MYLVIFFVQNGYTALFCAALKSHFSIVQLLLQQNADINICEKVHKYFTSRDVHKTFAVVKTAHTHVYSHIHCYRMGSVHCMWPVKRAVLRWWKVCWNVEQIPTTTLPYVNTLVCSLYVLHTLVCTKDMAWGETKPNCSFEALFVAAANYLEEE